MSYEHMSVLEGYHELTQVYVVDSLCVDFMIDGPHDLYTIKIALVWSLIIDDDSHYRVSMMIAITAIRIILSGETRFDSEYSV